MKTLQRILKSSETHWVGNGFPVSSVFAYDTLGAEFSPFLLLDYAAPHPFPPGNERRGVGGHPHKGFETVTIAYQGELAHRDSSGGGGTIGAGDVQWMTAGDGIVHEEFHSERFTRSGGVLEMVQLWVNLPAKDKSAAPGYQTLLKGDLPTLPLPGGAGTIRIIAGEYRHTPGPARTFTPINVWDVALEAGEETELPLPEGHTSLLFVQEGEAILPDDHQPLQKGSIASFSRVGEGLVVKAQRTTRLLVLTGEPINEPIVGRGPFVMNTEEEINAAYQQFRSGGMGQLD